MSASLIYHGNSSVSIIITLLIDRLISNCHNSLFSYSTGNMSSRIDELHACLSDEKNVICEGSNPIETETQETTLNACLDVLLYPDGSRKDLTHTTLKLIEEARPKMGEANALFVEGLRLFNYQDAPLKYFAEAESKGCNHPILYYYMTLCYTDPFKGRGTRGNRLKEVEYYTKSLGGMQRIIASYHDYFHLVLI